jgi:hypothetical protein
VADPWDTRNTRWEILFDQAVTLADARRLSDTLSMLKRIRPWQHRQSRPRLMPLVLLLLGFPCFDLLASARGNV